MIKVREVRIAIEVKRSDAGDVLPVALFFFADCDKHCDQIYRMFMFTGRAPKISKPVS